KMDAGPMLDQEVIDIGRSDIRPMVYEKLARSCVPLFSRALPSILKGGLRFNEQDENQVTYCRIITKEDGAVDFSASAEEIYNRSRACQPWPGIFFDYRDTRIRVGAADWEDRTVLEKPGTVLADPYGESDAKDLGLPVATGRGVIFLQSLQ